ncbi:hypothetical protein Hte_012135 [Hypoxylon texense]
MQISIVSRLPVLLAASASATLEKRVGGYDASCGEVRLDDNGNPQDLTGDCDSIGGFYTRKTRLDLNLCYSVDGDGHMFAQDAGHGLNNTNTSWPCEKCFNGNGYEVPTTYYACDCTPYAEGGVFTHSGVDLNALISNVDGYLTCFNHTAVFLSEYSN